MLQIRKSQKEDLNRLAEIFAIARKNMKESGNPNQWKNDRPAMSTIETDIEKGNSYVITKDEKIIGTFAYIRGVDPTYLEIEGQWLNDGEYGTIHRIASSGEEMGVLKTAIDFALSQGIDIRIDTHEANKIMRHLLDKYGFIECGIIITDDGTPRLAYQKTAEKKQKVLVIVGPTAVGKTAFGIKCAQDFDGEIISGDSIQIYKGLDIGSAKPDADELKQAKHYLIDIKEPFDNYSVKQFQELSRFYISQISGNKKLPIIVGGTGLYIKAALYDYVFYDEEEEDDQYEDYTNEKLYELLKEKDPEALEKIHINNRKRLIRALNIYEKHHKGISKIKSEQEHKMLYDCLIIGLTAAREELYSRIDQRVDQMMEKGLIKEIEGLLKKGVTFDNQCMQGIGYKEFRDYFEGNSSIEECAAKVKTNSRHFAKRQYTFFKNQLNVEWYENKDEAFKRVKEWLI